MKISLSDTFNKLPFPATQKWPQGIFDVEEFQHGTMSLILFAPEGSDYQTPHNQDELYIVVHGNGVLEIEGTPYQFSNGDVLFVSAGKPHRFTEFSKGIKMWAVLWGKDGGEGVA